MAPITPKGIVTRGIRNGKPFEGEMPKEQTFLEFQKECEAQEKRTERKKSRMDLSTVLPLSASKFLRDAYFEAQKYPEGSMKRAQVIELAIRKVRRDYSSKFKYDPSYCCCQR